MNKWIIDTGAIGTDHLEEMERHYDRWWTITYALESLQVGRKNQDYISSRPVSPVVLKDLEEQQQEAYEAYTSLAGGMVHKAHPWVR